MLQSNTSPLAPVVGRSLPSASILLGRALAGVLASLAALAGCTGSALVGDNGLSVSPNGGSGTNGNCDSTRCAAGNECISDGATSACRRPCTAQTGPSGCAFNWTCAQPDGAAKAYCVKNAVQFQKGNGQWGATCNPKNGFADNPDCDTAQSFWCYGVSPTDATAFCTQYQCSSDADCRGGYTCATVNRGPSVLTPRRSKGETTTVCLPRTYCSTCNADVDCPALPSGTPQVCVADATGQSKFCTSACANDANCNLDAKCEARPETEGSVCVPRAGVCKGGGSLCSPCMSDADCPKGLCISVPFSTEKFCSVTSAIPCEVSNNKLVADCPSAPSGAPYRVSCMPENDPDVPKDQCIGVVAFGEGNNLGCWTKSR